ncbi:short-chain dehydrogenase/reductase SDR [Segniliparus rotundus DSM 44985]|uniref:Short-chain dehydrogenase/reductase SDR n=1 Tax=Segniliparus rotundus (strain ATCC BAA-972 / CDC 1076 / CIP 108378 / DSM 44985 / JCM 13578) TaxID=640132 RepID=D6ZD56_SEGRD|nr:SDR family NAD(P)-dependent oxidoreductase [Segniliparus rotundus]ADG99243.1 short-chain dehydrogenase/reductase SDR [Segniliparus rotundus DSM 44985]
MHYFAGKVVVVTGAASGIGRALSMELARRGAKLAISDVDADGLAETKRLLEAEGAHVQADRLDVAEEQAVFLYADKVKEHFGVVHQVYNNAGVTFLGNFEKSSIKDIERVVDIDFWGVVYGSKAFLPHLIESGAGHIVNVSSVFGLFSVPSQTAYNAAKFAVRGFTESLRQELRAARRPVRVTTVHPGGIKTNIVNNAVFDENYDGARSMRLFHKIALTSPERAANIILNAVSKGRARVLVGPDAKFLDLFVRATGSWYQGVMGFVVDRMIPKSTS